MTARSALGGMALGGISAIISGFITHPMDTTKIRMQNSGKRGPPKNNIHKSVFKTFRMIVKNEGVSGLYKGILPSMLREMTYSSMRLGLYEPIKYLFGEKDPKTTPFLTKVISGGASGVIGASFTTPFDVLKVRMQSSESLEKQSIIKEIRTVVEQDSVWGLYKGTFPNVIRAFMLNAAKLSSYDEFKRFLLKNKLLEDGTQLFVTCGVFSGLCMTIATAPFDIVKTRIMSQTPDNKLYTGVIDCATKILKKEGPSAFYKGFYAQWMRFTPFTLINFVVWEHLRRLFNIRGI